MEALLRRVTSGHHPQQAVTAASRGHQHMRATAGSVEGPEIVASSSTTSAMGPKRVRQHVNPLALKFRDPISLPDWNTVFAQPTLPIHLDIGCARGKYLNAVAAASAGSINYIGVEIRQSVLDEARAEAHHRGLDNIAFIHANMNFQQKLLIPALPGPLQSISIFHPDPWMKKRHIKRRLVTDEFAHELAYLVEDNTPIFVQTDVQELFEYMVDVFNGTSLFALEPLRENPLGIPTDREKFVRGQGGDIYRVKLLVKKNVQSSGSP